MRMSFIVTLLVLVVVPLMAVIYSEEHKRYFYPEFKTRAIRGRNPKRTVQVQQTLKEAAGVYKNKTKGAELGHDRTVFITVVSYSDKSYYKLYFHNLLCYMQHHNIDIVVYLLTYRLEDPAGEVKILEDMGIKVLTYPEELFWTLMYSKQTETRMVTGKVDFLSKVPSFKSHGALVMLVPVLEVLLAGYNAIFFDVDIALVVDPVPFLTRGESDFVASIEMRSCPDHYTPTYLNQSLSNIKREHIARVNSMDNINYHTLEPNTGILMVRATEAGIGFYTNWLLRIISANEGNDQKVFFRGPETDHYSRDCLYGTGSDNLASMSHFFTGNVVNKSAHHYQQPHRPVEEVRAKWSANLALLVEDVAAGRYRKPMKFCFLSELLFQNGQTAFTCGGKPSFRDSFILEMSRKGLKTAEDVGNAGMIQPEEKLTPNGRFPVTVHANFCDRKTHELTVRGLWLVKSDVSESDFNASTCRAYIPGNTMYALQVNWTAEVAQIEHKRNYMYDTFVQPGGLIQSVIGMEVYYVNKAREKQLIPDGETFIATVGENKWDTVRFLPQPLMDQVPLGPPIPSVQGLPRALKEPTPQIQVVNTPMAGTTADAPAANSPPSPPSPLTLADGKRFFSAPPVAVDVPIRPVSTGHQAEDFHNQVVPGMLVRGLGSHVVYYIDKHLFRRKVPSMQVFHRLFGQRAYDVITLPEKTISKLRPGEPLV